MKKVLIVTLVCFFLSSSVIADELIVSMTWLEHWGGEDVIAGRGWITKLDTDTGVWERIFYTSSLGLTPIHAIATAPDGSIYFVLSDSHREGGIPMGYFYRIWKITPSVTLAGELEYGDETVVYEVYNAHDGTSTDDRIPYISDLAVRQNPATGVNRVYFSVACGACDDGHIYYVDDVLDFDPAVEYYTVFLDSLPIPSCGGTAGFWAGHFYFDESNNLFLSSGNHCPCALYQVSDAGLDSVAPGAIPEFILEHPSSIEDMEYAGTDRLYFLSSEPGIMQFTGDPFTESMLFSDSAVQDIEEIALWPTEAIGRLPWPGIKRSRALTRLMRPDLTITDFSVYPPRAGIVEPSPGLPVRISIRNSGGNISTSFKVSFTALYPGQTKPLPVPFNVPGLRGQKSGWIKSLRAGGKMTLAGFLKIEPLRETTVTRQEIAITAIVDSCLGEPDMPKHCRVEESDEENNQMTIKIKSPDR